MLLEHGANMDAVDRQGTTPLFYGVFFGSIDIIEVTS